MATDALWQEQHIRLKRCRDGALIYNINDTFVGRSLDKYGEFSQGDIIFLRQLITPGMTIVDVGANIGLLTVPFARLAQPTGKVIALEPQRIVYQMLCGNIALNALDNVFALNVAAGSSAGSITVPPVDYRQAGNFGAVSVETSGAGEVVPRVTIDALGLDHCELIKIDVEGMELDVLEGAAATMRQCQPRLYVECDRPGKSEAVIAHLLALDYRLYWHTPSLFRADNFFGDPEDIFPALVADNLVGSPRTGPLSLTVSDLVEITSPDTPPPRMIQGG